MATLNPYSDSLLTDALRGSLSNAESLGRGFAVAPVGLLGDINALGREYITPRLPQSVQGLLQAAPAAPTTEQILANIPRASAPRMETLGMEQLGAAMNFKGPVDVARGAGRIAGNAVNEAMVYDRGLLAGITPQPMRIVPTDVAKRIDMPVNLPQSKEFLKAVENEPSAQITDQGLLLNLRRSQNPSQSGLESVRSGVFYLPEGQSNNLKHYRGNTNYGGNEPIQGETLYKNPLFVKGATGGKAPEMAYAQLTDKAELKNLQDDIQKAMFSGSPSMRNELVQQFLDKHAPDLSDYTSYIIDNSKKGNQLRYALQEAAVAQKVRDSGHDAVLGYGKGRGDKGEFFSEVFDVRESHYPTPRGDFELMPQFEGLLK